MASGVSLQIQPGKGLGFLSLGASLHDVLVRLRAQSHAYPDINVSFSQSDTLRLPVIVSLSHNGIRLRFDGPEQRLRLIEVIDFTRLSLSYKNTKSTSPVTVPSGSRGLGGPKKATGPSFRQIYDIFSVTFPGEYVAPPSSSKRGGGAVSGGAGSSSRPLGSYVLSYPGLAFSFSVEHAAWASAGEADFVKVLSSSAASSARAMAIFNGGSWKEIKKSYMTEHLPYPRSLHATTKTAADDVELVRVKGKGRVTVQRRYSRLDVAVGRTTVQDVVAALGPPDFVYRKHDWRLNIHKRRTTSTAAARPVVDDDDFHRHHHRDRSAMGHEYDEMSAITDDDDSISDDEPAAAVGLGPERDDDCFYNYFRHGMDIYFSEHTHASPPLTPSSSPTYVPPSGAGLVVTKIVLHANIPGSHAFNRYRRCRWVVDPARLYPSSAANTVVNANTTPSTRDQQKHRQQQQPQLTSESRFAVIGSTLRRIWAPVYASDDERRRAERPMVYNRSLMDSLGSSCELLDDLDESDITLPGSGGVRSGGFKGAKKAPENLVGNARLYGFSGLLFEVQPNDAVSCLTIY